MHLGIWDDTTKTLHDALLNENELLAELGKIKDGERVLDAGCGVGGSSIYLAKTRNCQCTGITLVEEQVKRANNFAKRDQVSALVDFQCQDYTQTNFPDKSFDIVWAINSACYAEPKMIFIKEAYRLLKPGGRLLISDAFASKEKMSEAETKLLYDKAYHGWVVNKLATSESFLKDMETTGFSDCEFKDTTQGALPSVKRLYWYYYPATLYNKFSLLKGKRFSPIQLKNTSMLYHLYKALKKDLWKYGMVVGTKIDIR